MPLQKITGPDHTEMTGFVVVDLEHADSADGIVRSAKKILIDGARTMARSRSYSWALLERRISGASAGVNVPPPLRAEGLAAFVEAVAERVQRGELSLDAGKGVTSDDLAELRAGDQRSALRLAAGPHGDLTDELTAHGAAVAAAVALDGLQGRTVAIEGAGAVGPVLLQVLAQMGATVVAIGTASGTVADPSGLDTGATATSWAEHGDALPSVAGSDLEAGAVLSVAADVLMCGSKLGLVDHDIAGGLQVQVLAPIGVAPVTAKGLAVATRSSVTVLPDFLTLSAPLHAFHADGSLTAEECISVAHASISELTAAALAHPKGAYLGACAAAEDFLGSWQDELPFGRPLA